MKRTGKDEKGYLRIGCRLCHGTQRTRTPMSPRSTGKPRRLASKRTPEPPQHTRGSSAATASLMGIDLFSLEGEISNIGQPIGHPHREYNTITTPKTCQYNQPSSAMVKTVHFPLGPGFDSQALSFFFNLLDPDGTKGTSDMQAVESHRSDRDGEWSHRYT